MTDLITSLSKLDAPDRKVDAEIALALDLFETQPNKGWPDRLDYGRREENGSVTWPGHGFDQLIPRYTASVDAAIALAERVLPGWVFEHIGQDYIRASGLDNDVMPMGWTVEISDGSKTIQGQAPTFPLAICIALLRAKEASKP